MVYLITQHRVANYEKWRQVFDANESFRRDGGATGTMQVYRDIVDPNTVTVILEWNELDKARKFLSDPALAELMQKAGVIGQPIFRSILTRT